jgi:magnesium-transporting ATPase (P-type)
MKTIDALIKTGLIFFGIIIILVAVFAVPRYVHHYIPQIIEISIVFIVLLLAFFVVWKANK